MQTEPQQPQTPMQVHQMQVELAALNEMHDVLVRLNINVRNFSPESRKRLAHYVQQMAALIAGSFGEGGQA